jgi:lysophospholipid acyltransferase (LPLAT)-like uncharacterized protein
VVANSIRLLAGTLRYSVNGAAGPVKLPEEPVIFALWHKHLALCMKVYESFVRPNYKDDHLVALISAGRDGALLAAILRNFGVQSVRGSSSRRGGHALVELTSWAQRGYDLALTPDGPRGPSCVVQEGVVALAQVTGMPIVPYSCRLAWKICLESWDRFEIPVPFSRCEMAFSEPFRVPRDATEAERVQLRERLQNVLWTGTM